MKKIYEKYKMQNTKYKVNEKCPYGEADSDPPPFTAAGKV